jgi:hypothetical protein
MKTTLTTSQAAHELLNDPDASWTYSGAHAIVEYLEELENDTGTEVEFDRVSIRCDFSEYDDLISWSDSYFGSHEKTLEEFGFTPESFEVDEVLEKIREFIECHGVLIEHSTGIIVSSF